MRELAQKLMHLHYTSEISANLPSAIFGSAGDLASNLETRVPYRIGIWPCISAEAPEVALGLMSVLGSLLERWHDILVYPLFVKIEGESENYTPSPADTQFTVDDWQLEGLDDNVGVWGTFKRDGAGWVLALEAENDFDEETRSWTYQAADLGGIVNQLPKAASDIATSLNVDHLRVSGIQPYSSISRDEQALQSLLKRLGEWDVNLLLWLWGRDWESKADHIALVNEAQRLDSEFGAWVFAHATARAMLPGYELPLGDSLLLVGEVVEKFPSEGIVPIILSGSLYQLGEVEKAVDLLEAEVQAQPSRTEAWLTLADLYRQRGQVREAIDTFQRAIEAEAVNATLFVNYAVLLPLAEAAGLKIEEFILIDPQDSMLNGYFVTWEAIEAYEEALKLSSNNSANLLSLQMGLLIDLRRENDRFWDTFERLVKADTGGEYVRAVIDQFYFLEDIEPAVEILEARVEEYPARYDLHVNLAAVYLIDEEHDAALEELETARGLTEDPVAIADIDRLMLSAEDPEFESLMGEIVDKLGAQNKLTTEEVEFLEEVVEAAPTYSEAYQLLARAYILWEEHATALETLLDAEKHLPNDAEILEGISRLLWRDGQNELAMTYINRGLETNPLHVPLLAFGGQCLFEDGQEDAARIYLTKAEAIAPNHPALQRARVRITQLLND